MNWIKLLCFSLGLTLAMAGIVRFIVKAFEDKRFGVASLLCLTALVAVGVVIYLASRNWSPR